MSDRQPIALIGHDVVGTGGRMGNLPGLPPHESQNHRKRRLKWLELQMMR